jgi:hypothetical protein
MIYLTKTFKNGAQFKMHDLNLVSHKLHICMYMYVHI